MLIRQRECHSYYRYVHYYVIICPDHSLPSYWMRRLSTRRKKWTWSFFVVVESKLNRSQIARQGYQNYYKTSAASERAKRPPDERLTEDCGARPGWTVLPLDQPTDRHQGRGAAWMPPVSLQVLLQLWCKLLVASCGLQLGSFNFWLYRCDSGLRERSQVK